MSHGYTEEPEHLIRVQRAREETDWLEDREDWVQHQITLLMQSLDPPERHRVMRAAYRRWVGDAGVSP